MKNKQYKKDTSIGIKRFIKSFKNAFHGIKAAYEDEENLFIHTIMAVIVIALAFILRVSVIEWLFLILAITIVMMSELFNSAIERAVDCASLEVNEYAKKSKDIASAAVLFAAFIASIIGMIIFIPRIVALF